MRFRIETLIFCVFMLGICSTATYFQWFRTLDLALYDTLVSAFTTPVPDDVVIVGIDEQSLSNYGSWPWPRSLQGELISSIAEQQPKAVVMDFVYGNQSNPSADQQLTDAAATVELLALPVIVDALASRRQLIEVLPYPELLDVTDVLGHVHVTLDSDAIARGVYLYQGIGDAHWPHLALALAQALGFAENMSADCDSESFSLQNHQCDYVQLAFAGPPGTLAEISAADLLEGRIDQQQLSDKIVFVGITTTAAPDSITSPVSGNDRPMSGVEFNVNLFSSIVQEQIIRNSAVSYQYLIALLCVLLAVILLPRLKPTSMLIAAIGIALVPLLLTVMSFVIGHVNLPLGAGFVTCLLSYPYWSWRRHEVAWQFVNTEISRLEVEKPHWVFTAQGQSIDEEVLALKDLLQAEVVWHENSISVPGMNIQNDQHISIAADDGRWFVLSRAEPFSHAERSLVERLHPQLASTESSLKMPGEVLAAQIRKLQQAAREVRVGREAGLRGLAEMPNGVAVVSALNQVKFVNRACRQLLDLDGNQDGVGLYSLVQGLAPPLGQSWSEISRAVILDQQAISFETHTRSNVPVVVDAAPLNVSGEVPESWVITITDMSDVRIAEREREEALAFLSHDLRSPMLSVLALVRTNQETDLLAEIGRNAQKALSVSEQFLQLSRVQAREHFETYELDLVIVLHNAIDQVYPSAQEKGIAVGFKQKIADVEGAWIVGNGELLERVFVNLLTNAIKFSQTDNPVEVNIGEQAGHYVVDVQDHGTGIPSDELGQIFDPYFRSSEPALAAKRGSGLGLRFVKTVVERHGGRVEVQSELNEGSRFTVTLVKPVSAGL